MERLRAVVVATVTAVAALAFLTFWMHAPDFVAAAASAALFVGVLAAAGDRGDARTNAADAAWREAAPDLPPASRPGPFASSDAVRPRNEDKPS